MSVAAVLGAWGPIGSERRSSRRPRFFLAAREAAHHQQAHQRDDHEPERTHLEGHLPAEGVEALGGPVERDGRRIAFRGLGRLAEIGRGRIQPLDAGDRRHDQHHDGGDPDDDPDTVATQDETGEGGGTRELGRRRHRWSSASRSIRARSLASSSP
jgi:hypothetical protein